MASPPLSESTSDIIRRYLELPKMSNPQAAKALGVPFGTLLSAKHDAGLSRPRTGKRRQEDQAKAERAQKVREASHIKDQELAMAYAQLRKPIGNKTAATMLGCSWDRLRAAISRTGGASGHLWAGRAPEAITGAGRSGEALPAGHPITWGAISNEPWPGDRG